MALKFKNKKVTIINYYDSLKVEEVDKIKSSYHLDDVEEVLYVCKGYGKAEKPLYLQCVDWIKLIPESVIKNDSYAIALPEDLPSAISVYMITEIFSKSGKMPRILEFKNDEFNRIVDLEYEVNFSKNKRKESSFKKNNNYNSEEYNVNTLEKNFNK